MTTHERFLAAVALLKRAREAGEDEGTVTILEELVADLKYEDMALHPWAGPEYPVPTMKDYQ